jgi:hypothetical protein
MGASRGIDRRPPRLVASRRHSVRRPLLLHRRDQPRSSPRTHRRPSDLAGQLGIADRRRTARLADGWLASAYNTTPTLFAAGWSQLRDLLPGHGKDPGSFPNALATMWFYITDNQGEADMVMRERVVPTIHRPDEMLRERLPVGPAELFAEKLSAFARKGVQRVFVWPVADEAHQLELFWETVRPAVAA